MAPHHSCTSYPTVSICITGVHPILHVALHHSCSSYFYVNLHHWWSSYLFYVSLCITGVHPNVSCHSSSLVVILSLSVTLHHRCLSHPYMLLCITGVQPIFTCGSGPLVLILSLRVTLHHLYRSLLSSAIGVYSIFRCGCNRYPSDLYWQLSSRCHSIFRYGYRTDVHRTFILSSAKDVYSIFTCGCNRCQSDLPS